MKFISPTILAANEEEYRQQLDRVSPFASRLHIDFGDGEFTTKSLDLASSFWPEDKRVDLHIMYKYPTHIQDKIIEMMPHLVIVHKEAEEDLIDFMDKLQGKGIDVGIAILQNTSVESAREEIYRANHVLIFSGSLGSFGGEVDFGMLDKVDEIRRINPSIEIGWDGGVNDQNARQLIDGGVDVINVGGFIQKSENPQEAYAILESIVQGGGND